MITEFKVGDIIWWLDNRKPDKPRIISSVIVLIEWEEYYNRYKFEIGNHSDYKTTYIWSSNTIIARTKEDLISLLCPYKVGPFEYNQLVYVVRNIKDKADLQIVKAYVKGPSILTSQYVLSTNIYEDKLNTFTASIENIYSTLDLAKQTIETWLNKDVN